LDISLKKLRRIRAKQGNVIPKFLKNYISRFYRRRYNRKGKMMMNTYIRYHRAFYVNRRRPPFQSLRKCIAEELAAEKEEKREEKKEEQGEEKEKKEDIEINIYKLIKKWGNLDLAFSEFFVNICKEENGLDFEDAEFLYREAMGLFLLEHTVKKLLAYYAGPGFFEKIIGIFLYSSLYNHSMWKFEFKFLVIFFFLN